MESATKYNNLGMQGSVMIPTATTITTDKTQISTTKNQIIVEEVVVVALEVIEILTTQVGSIKQLSNNDNNLILSLIRTSNISKKTIILITSRKKTINNSQQVRM